MDFASSIVKKEDTNWRPLILNVQCEQVLLTEVPSVLSLYPFDIISPGGGILSKGYEILAEDRTHKGRLREGDVKTITLVDEHAMLCSYSNLAYVEYLGCSTRNGCRLDKCNWKGKNHFEWHRQPERQFQSRTNATPSSIMTELINSAKVLSKTSNTSTNQVQPYFTRFASNLETIQNAIKYNRKQNYTSVNEFEKDNIDKENYKPNSLESETINSADKNMKIYYLK
ncbi:22511_t:CDS:2, partial [Gigaspora rosea]